MIQGSDKKENDRRFHFCSKWLAFGKNWFKWRLRKIISFHKNWVRYRPESKKIPSISNCWPMHIRMKYIYGIDSCSIDTIFFHFDPKQIYCNIHSITDTQHSATIHLQFIKIIIQISISAEMNCYISFFSFFLFSCFLSLLLDVLHHALKSVLLRLFVPRITL